MPKEYKLQLTDMATGKAIFHAGKFYVTTSGGTAKLAITDLSDASITQPGTISSGAIKFRTAETVASVDVYLKTDKGYAKVLKGITPGGNVSIPLDLNQLNQVTQIPFNIADTTATTETDTGFDLATNEVVLPYGVGVRVVTLDATETIDFGILSSESGGDANGFGAALSVGTAVLVTAEASLSSDVVGASPTRGALLANNDAGAGDDDRGIHCPKAFVCDGTAKSISYTLTSGTDTAAGILIIPSMLPAVQE